MSPKARPTQDPHQPGPSSHEKAAFWGEDEAQFAEEKKRVSEQISRLQQRQMELVQQTAQELEDLKQQLEDSKAMEHKIAKAKEPLVNEVNSLRLTLGTLEKEKKQLEDQLEQTQQQFQSHHSQMQGTLDSLKNVIRAQARTFDQQIRVFSLDANQSIESLLASVDSATLPVPDLSAPTPKPAAPVEPMAPQPTPAIAHTVTLEKEGQHPSFLEHAQKLEEQHKKKEKPVKERRPRVFSARKFAVRALSLGLVVAAGYGGYTYVLPKLGSNAAGQVAGVSTAVPTADAATEPDYKESLTDLPLAATEWDNFADPDFGVSLSYPKNTSNHVRTVGSDNMYFLRHTGYMMKLTKFDSTETLDQWWSENAGLFTSDYSISKGTFKNQPAYVLKSQPGADIAATQYIIKRPTQIVEVWVQNFPTDNPDSSRVAKMLDTLQFTK